MSRKLTTSLLFLSAIFFGQGLAEARQVIDRIEEDWELVIREPDTIADGPQITTLMSPSGKLEGEFVAFNLNYRGQLPYEAGGLEVVAYQDDQVLDSATQHTELLNHAGESVTWTQSMSLSNGKLRYDIHNGDSTTWGKFGQGSGENLGLEFSTNLTTLLGYSSAVSEQFSGAGWQPNHVQSLRILAIRAYSGGVLVAEDNVPRDIISDSND